MHVLPNTLYSGVCSSGRNKDIKVRHMRTLHVHFKILVLYFNMSAFVPSRVIRTTGERVISSSGPTYTEGYE
jgi:hypothetical protein